MSAWQKVLKTDADWAATAARVALGLVMLPHGAQKALGWFGGYGVEGTLGYFESIGIPTIAGVLVIGAEFLGALGLITGLLGRAAAAGIIPVMVGAVVLTHARNGFFMNWAGAQVGEGFEFHIFAVALALVVVIRGSGAASLDRWLSRTEQPAPAVRELARAA
jgi:putative oxidoreductase